MTSSSRRLVVVTGANQGIGFEAVKRFAQRPEFHTILTSRGQDRGAEALQKIQEEFPNASVETMQLDLDSDASQEAFVDALEKNYGGKVACLVNNAGVAGMHPSDASDVEKTRATISTNVLQTIKFTERMLPLLKKETSPRVVIVASTMADRAFQDCDEKVQQRLVAPEISTADIVTMANEYVDAVEQGEVKQRGFPEIWLHWYCLSKLFDVQYARALAREQPDVLVSACCPGWCQTNLGRGAGEPPLSAAQGAEVLEFCTTSDELEGKSGGFWHENKLKAPYESA